MDKIKIDLLAVFEIEEGPNQLEVIRKFGKIAQGTDTFQLTGSTDWEKSSDCWYATKSMSDYAFASKTLYDTFESIDYIGIPYKTEFKHRVGIRPVLELPEELFKRIISNQVIDEKGIARVKFGEYPQDVLDEAKLNEDITSTGNQFTFDGTNHRLESQEDELYGKMPFNPISFNEYICNNTKFIRLAANPIPKGGKKVSNGKIYQSGEIVWVEVAPITWLVDEKNHRLISEKSLVSGVRYNDPDKKIKSFEESELYVYMNKYLLPEMLQSETRKYEKEIIDNMTISDYQMSSLENKISEDNNLSEEEQKELLNALCQIKDEPNIKRR